MKAKKEIRLFVILYLAHFLGWMAFIVIMATSRGQGFSDSVKLYFGLFVNVSFLLFFHILFALLYGIIHLCRYFIRVYRQQGRRVFWKRLGLRLLLPSLLVFGSFKALVYNNASEAFDFNWDDNIYNETGRSFDHFADDGKYRGMSVFGWWDYKEDAFDSLVKNNIEWAAVVPFIYQKDENTDEVNLRETYDRWSRRDSMFIDIIGELHERGIHVQLKPHIWLREGWRSNIKLDNARNWGSWFESYRVTMLHYARMAEKTGVELFCVGTELRTSILQQPDKWKELIEEVRTVYTGKITYAANWHDEFEHIDFWDQLDYIGLQAYFPLTDNKNPDLETIKQGWDRYIPMLEELSATYNKQILFTEVGYKSEASATIKPWEWGNSLSILTRKKSDETQQLAYEALFQKLWAEDWFAGMFIWEWNTMSKPENAPTNLNFSPRFKPAENTIAKWYGKEP